ncbi:hypothetical protein [Halalkalicoccus ordinarius]|uniref:hypothetical protein n=1 Tax=Halalkalicoccus ordinarius TaxID=3116651 RepID=UPI00300EEA27
MLSLASDAEAYGVPISFGYDGDGRCYFVLLRVGERSRTEEFVGTAERTSLTAYQVRRSTSGGA